MENSRLTEMLESARKLGVEGRVVSATVHRLFAVPDAAIECLACNGYNVSEEFVGPDPILWSQVVVGARFNMRKNVFVVVEVDEREHVAWLIKELYLEAVN